MEIETLVRPATVTLERSPPPASSDDFDLKTMVENMKHRQKWAKGQLDAMILLNRPEKQIVLTASPEGTQIDSIQSKDSVTIRIVEGNMEFNTQKESVRLTVGQILTLHEKIKYSLVSLEDTVFLIIILNNDSQRSEY